MIRSEVTVASGDLDLELIADIEVQGKDVGLGLDLETTGLSPVDDQVQVISVSVPGTVIVIQIDPERRPSNLGQLLANDSILKIFHNALFDMSFIRATWGYQVESVFCTKVAARVAGLARNPHLRDLTSSLLDIELDKSQQVSNWANRPLTDAQIAYAASDVAYLHSLRQELVWKLSDAGRSELFESCMRFLPSRVDLALLGLDDVFAYSI